MRPFSRSDWSRWPSPVAFPAASPRFRPSRRKPNPERCFQAAAAQPGKTGYFGTISGGATNWTTAPQELRTTKTARSYHSILKNQGCKKELAQQLEGVKDCASSLLERPQRFLEIFRQRRFNGDLFF